MTPPSVRVLIAALVAVSLMPIVADATAVPADKTLKVAMTAYNAVPDQTDSNPLETASGAYSDPNVVAARSSDLAGKLPFGTVIEIDSASSSPSCGYTVVGKKIGLRVIADAMNSKWRNKIDILLPQQVTLGGKTMNPANVLGICNNVTIKVVGHVSISNMPHTQDELASDLNSSAEVAVAK